MATAFWATGRTGVASVGDLFDGAPVLAGPLVKTVDSKDEPVSLLYRVRLDLALIVAEFPGLIWLAPVVQQHHFTDPQTFVHLAAAAQAGALRDWFWLQPVGHQLVGPGLALLSRPSALPPDALEIAASRRVASLTPVQVAHLLASIRILV